MCNEPTDNPTTATPADERKWCWATSEESEHWYGPFDTREAALAEAEAGQDSEGIVLSRCNYADPSEAAEAWADTFDPLESLNDHTDEELQDYDDGNTYAFIKGAAFAESAKRELSEAIIAWTKKHVKTRWFSADNDAMEVIK